MRNPLLLLLTAVAALGVALPAKAQTSAGDTPPSSAPTSFVGKSIDQMTADEVLRLVRYSYTLYDQDFQAHLRMGIAKRVSFVLSLKPEAIRFIFDDPAQMIFLDTRDQKFALYEGFGGQEMKPVPSSKYGEQIRGTDVTYDDLSMRFLYWPNAKVVKQDRIKARDSVVVRVRNPDGSGAYATVDIWIDKESGGMLKMIGYNLEGRPIRRFEVIHGKKFGDVWMVDDMRIESVAGATGGQILSSTRMQIQSKAN